jgi:hypothetical protein
MKKSIKNLEVKSIKNIKAVKGGDDDGGGLSPSVTKVVTSRKLIVE